jgi:hypothetical protein
MEKIFSYIIAIFHLSLPVNVRYKMQKIFYMRMLLISSEEVGGELWLAQAKNYF